MLERVIKLLTCGSSESRGESLPPSGLGSCSRHCSIPEGEGEGGWTVRGVVMKGEGEKIG